MSLNVFWFGTQLVAAAAKRYDHFLTQPSLPISLVGSCCLLLLLLLRTCVYVREPGEINKIKNVKGLTGEEEKAEEKEEEKEGGDDGCGGGV